MYFCSSILVVLLFYLDQSWAEHGSTSFHTQQWPAGVPVKLAHILMHLRLNAQSSKLAIVYNAARCIIHVTDMQAAVDDRLIAGDKQTSWCHVCDELVASLQGHCECVKSYNELQQIAPAYGMTHSRDHPNPEKIVYIALF